MSGKYLTLLKIVKVTRNKETLRNCPSLKNPKEIRRLKVTWVPGRTLGKG